MRGVAGWGTAQAATGHALTPVSGYSALLI